MATLVNNADGTISIVVAPGETSVTIPQGVSSLLREEAWSAGAAGGTTDATAANAGGGGSGSGYGRNANRAVVPGATYACQVGSGSLGSSSRDTFFVSTSRLYVPAGSAGGSVTGLGGAGAGGTPAALSAIVAETKYQGGAGGAGSAATSGGGGGGAGDAGAGGAGSGNTAGTGGTNRGGRGGNQSGTATAGQPYGGGAYGSSGLANPASAAGDGGLILTFVPVALASLVTTPTTSESQTTIRQEQAATAATAAQSSGEQQPAIYLVSAVNCVETPRTDAPTGLVTRPSHYARVIGYGFEDVAKDYATGALLSGVTVKVFREPEDTRVAMTTTDANGAWRVGVLDGYTYNVKWIRYGATHNDDYTWASPEGNAPAVVVVADNL